MAIVGDRFERQAVSEGWGHQMRARYGTSATAHDTACLAPPAPFTPYGHRSSHDVAEHNGDAPPKFLLYSHDTFGLGNVRRTLLIAGALRDEYPEAAILILTGSPIIHAFRLPTGVDYIKLPCLDRTDADCYEPM